MTNEAKHTDLPWCYVIERTKTGELQGVWIAQDTGEDDVNGELQIADITPSTFLFDDDDEKDMIARAKFIVRACNSHYELLEALQRIEKHFEPNNLNEWKDLALEMAEVARTAIAKVKNIDN